jgi:hypothetical protein
MTRSRPTTSAITGSDDDVNLAGSETFYRHPFGRKLRQMATERGRYPPIGRRARTLGGMAQ